MSEAQPQVRSKTKSKSKHSSPRLYNPTDMVQLMQPIKLPWTVSTDQRKHRPKSEIVWELQRLRSLPLRVDDDAGEVDRIMDEAATTTTATMPIRTLAELDALRLTRHRIEQLLRCTNFEATVRSCFVRVNVNPMTVPPDYRIGEIMGITELAEGYYVGKTPTNIVLHLRYEDLVEKHELNDISNMAFTTEEFDFWHDNCICQGYEWPTVELIASKKIELYHALNSEGKLSSVLKQSGLIPISMPMRPVPRGGLLERSGRAYPWKLQRPQSPSPSPILKDFQLPNVAFGQESGVEIMSKPKEVSKGIEETKMKMKAVVEPHQRQEQKQEQKQDQKPDSVEKAKPEKMEQKQTPIVESGIPSA